MDRDANGVRGCRAATADTDAIAGMSAAERLDEVARILALGIKRLQNRRQAKKSSNPNQLSEFGLDFSPEQSVCREENNKTGESS